MKTKTIVAASVAIALSMVVSTQAAWAQGKTRAEVKQELVQAQHEGIVPAGKNDYPPSKALIKRNQATHAVSVHGGKPSATLDEHDKQAAAR
ncbi:hypothetical protein WS67_06350 [Burkholderia singularis]|uniref:DUF4148 domain-containing protein n=1 Tax=Burkholderia singularis TaxID=1503053 RepID=A0A103E4U8_9BURK|nr:DUF4148 domain-containing protein [Burkholderia singularis]KVE28380.1 hypothetical protein WS67_06350 [Burkholderia singularis]